MAVFGNTNTVTSWESLGAEIETLFLTPGDIFFNKLGLTDINIFDFTNATDTIISLRTQVSTWYLILRTISIMILLGILVYIAIRMAINTVASEKAKYKEMLVNWTSSIALVFVLHYVIIAILTLNSTFVSIADDLVQAAGGKGFRSGVAVLMGIAATPIAAFTKRVSAIIILGMIIAQTVGFLGYYIKRMLTVCFLVVISPLITITYSIDKLGDGKSQALNNWMREFFFTVIIQPFHCIIYAVFISLSISLLIDNSSWGSAFASSVNDGGLHSLAAGLLSIFCMKFIWDGEKIIKNIFGIKVSESLGEAIAGAAITGTLLTKGVSLAKDSKMGEKMFTNLGKSNNPFLSRMGKGYDKINNFAKKFDPYTQGKEGAKRLDELNKKSAEIGGDQYLSREEKAEMVNLRNNRFVKGYKRWEKHKTFHRATEKMDHVRDNGPAAVVAAMASSFMYGANSKTNMVEAVASGAASYKTIDNIWENYNKRKSEVVEQHFREIHEVLLINEGTSYTEADITRNAVADKMEEIVGTKTTTEQTRSTAKDNLVEYFEDEKGLSKREAKINAESLLNRYYSACNNLKPNVDELASSFGIQDPKKLSDMIKDYGNDVITDRAQKMLVYLQDDPSKDSDSQKETAKERIREWKYNSDDDGTMEPKDQETKPYKTFEERENAINETVEKLKRDIQTGNATDSKLLEAVQNLATIDKLADPTDIATYVNDAIRTGNIVPELEAIIKRAVSDCFNRLNDPGVYTVNDHFKEVHFKQIVDRASTVTNGNVDIDIGNIVSRIEQKAIDGYSPLSNEEKDKVQKDVSMEVVRKCFESIPQPPPTP